MSSPHRIVRKVRGASLAKVERTWWAVMAVVIWGAGGVPVALTQDLSERPLQRLIDCPTAGGPERGSYELEMRGYPRGGMMLGLAAGIIPRFWAGVSYGGSEVIGFGKVRWNPRAGLAAGIQILSESRSLPGFAVGVNTQGSGSWVDSTREFQYRAKGVFGVISRNYRIAELGEWAWHFGGNQPLDRHAKRPDAFVGVEVQMLRRAAVLAEYSAGLDTWRDGTFRRRDRGNLNVAFRWRFGERLAGDLVLRDLRKNLSTDLRGGNQVGREIRLYYVQYY